MPRACAASGCRHSEDLIWAGPHIVFGGIWFSVFFLYGLPPIHLALSRRSLFREMDGRPVYSVWAQLLQRIAVPVAVAGIQGGLAVTTSDLHTEGAGFKSICAHLSCSSVLVLRATSRRIRWWPGPTHRPGFILAGTLSPM